MSHCGVTPRAIQSTEAEELGIGGAGAVSSHRADGMIYRQTPRSEKPFHREAGEEFDEHWSFRVGGFPVKRGDFGSSSIPARRADETSVREDWILRAWACLAERIVGTPRLEGRSPNKLASPGVEFGENLPCRSGAPKLLELSRSYVFSARGGGKAH